jgi:hypothetical protein
MKTQNILFKYSPSIGMMERLYTDIQASSLEEWADTKDQAMITFYLTELAVAYDAQISLLHKLKEVDKTIADLDKTFGHLKEKYPEEFV